MFDARYPTTRYTLKKRGRLYVPSVSPTKWLVTRTRVRAQSGLYPLFSSPRLVMVSGLILERLERAWNTYLWRNSGGGFIRARMIFGRGREGEGKGWREQKRKRIDFAGPRYRGASYGSRSTVYHCLSNRENFTKNQSRRQLQFCNRALYSSRYAVANVDENKLRGDMRFFFFFWTQKIAPKASSWREFIKMY